MLVLSENVVPTGECRCAVERSRTSDQVFAVAPDAGGGWPAWTAALARFLASLATRPTHCIVLGRVDDPRYVQMMIGYGRLHLEATSNHYLAGDHRLSATEEDLLRALGFRHPSTAASGMPENWWLDRTITSSAAVAELVATTLIAITAVDSRDPLTMWVVGADEPCESCSWSR